MQDIHCINVWSLRVAEICICTDVCKNHHKPEGMLAKCSGKRRRCVHALQIIEFDRQNKRCRLWCELVKTQVELTCAHREQQREISPPVHHQRQAAWTPPNWKFDVCKQCWNFARLLQLSINLPGHNWRPSQHMTKLLLCKHSCYLLTSCLPGLHRCVTHSSVPFARLVLCVSFLLFTALLACLLLRNAAILTRFLVQPLRHTLPCHYRTEYTCARYIISLLVSGS